eukprot:364699-Chlamydomonas_euryale.AAC.16
MHRWSITREQQDEWHPPCKCVVRPGCGTLWKWSWTVHLNGTRLLIRYASKVVHVHVLCSACCKAMADSSTTKHTGLFRYNSFHSSAETVHSWHVTVQVSFTMPVFPGFPISNHVQGRKYHQLLRHSTQEHSTVGSYKQPALPVMIVWTSQPVRAGFCVEMRVACSASTENTCDAAPCISFVGKTPQRFVNHFHSCRSDS